MEDTENSFELSEEEFLKKKPVMLDFIAHNLYVCNNRLIAPLGLTFSQAKILIRLFHADDMLLPQSELKGFGRCGSTLTSVLANLEKNDFIYREASEQDARAKYVGLTQRGFAAAIFAMANTADLNDLIDSLLTKKEAHTLQCLLEKLANAVADGVLEDFDPVIHGELTETEEGFDDT